MFIKLGVQCPIIPDTVDTTQIVKFRDWLSTDPLDYEGFPFHNGLKLFLWIIYEFYHLDYEQT